MSVPLEFLEGVIVLKKKKRTRISLIRTDAMYLEMARTAIFLFKNALILASRY